MSYLEADFQARLAQLDLCLRGAFPASFRGERRAPRRKGISLEFADFRNYVPGDDVRHLDHASYARLDQLIIRLYHDEEEMQVHLLLDDSASMEEGQPSKAKRGRELIAALAWIGISRGHRVHFTRLGDQAIPAPPLGGASALRSLFRELDQPSSSGRRPLHLVLREHLSSARPKGLIVLVSDLMDDAGPAEILRSLAVPNVEIDVLHLLSPQEMTPDLQGDLRLSDVETGNEVEVSITAASLAAYHRSLQSFLSECSGLCQRHEAAYVSLNSAWTLEELIVDHLLRQGLLR